MKSYFFTYIQNGEAENQNPDHTIPAMKKRWQLTVEMLFLRDTETGKSCWEHGLN